MTVSSVPAAAGYLDRALQRVEAVAPLTASGPVSLADAYQIQAEAFDLRLARGESGCGVKLGFTSRAKMTQMGVSEVIAGRLTRQARIPDGGEVDLDRLIHPRVEPELAYLLGRDLDPAAAPEPGPEAVAAVAPALEIIDSRYRDFSFTVADVIADNASAARYAIGPWTRPDRIPAGSDLGNLAVRLELSGRTAQVGSTAAILGHPIRVLPALATLSRSAGIPLRAGDVVLAGAATPAESLPAGLVEVEVAGLGRVAVRGVRHG